MTVFSLDPKVRFNKDVYFTETVNDKVEFILSTYPLLFRPSFLPLLFPPQRHTVDRSSIPVQIIIFYSFVYTDPMTVEECLVGSYRSLW